MWSSAIASSSPVVIPGRQASRRSSRVWPVSSPARRIRSICSGVLISTPRSRRPIGGSGSALGHDVEGVEDPLRDLVDLAHAVDLEEDAVLAVDLDQRLGLLGVHLLATPDDVLGVVGTALALGAMDQSRHELVLVDGEDDGGVEPVPGVAD